MQKKTCKACKKLFTPERNFQSTCDYNCAIAYAKVQEAKKVKSKKQANRKALKKFNNSDVAVMKRKAQTIFNKYIRLRDGEICISCGYTPSKDAHKRQFHAGHYKPQGGNSLLRYEEDNVHAQCSICNNHLSGNLVPYRVNLIEKIGLERVEELENMNTIKKWTIEELSEIIKTCKERIKKHEASART